jgi:uncharacterized protein (DUF58 family)
MLTSRGWWFLLVVLLLLANAVLGQYAMNALWPGLHLTALQPGILGLLPLTLLLWFLWEWLVFAIRAQMTVRQLTFQREVRDDHGPVSTLWAGRTFQIQVRLKDVGAIGFPYLVVTDRVPFGTVVGRIGDPSSSDSAYEGALTPGQEVTWTYSLRCTAAGRMRFDGLAVQMSDLQGFFYRATFLAQPAEYPVLPSLVDAEGRPVGVKRHNLLLPPGIHRFRRPGSGSELLDLRDYVPGDPPKTIAWKVSARRDRLITKEFESEVPVRCTLFLDTSNSVCLGPPGQNALTRLVEIAAATAQSALDNRDLVGLCCFDEDGSRYIRPARGARHLIQVLNLLAAVAGRTPTTGDADLNTLLPLGYALAQEVYPELLRPDLNRFPFWLAWLWPPPRSTVRRPTPADAVYAWLPYLLPVYALVGLVVLGVLFLEVLLLLNAAEARSVVSLLVLVAAAFGVIMAFFRIPAAYFFPERRRMLRWRKRLAAVLSVRYDLAPGGLGVLLEDDERLGYYLQRFLAEHHVPYPLPLYDLHGRYLFAAPGKVTVLATALLRSVGKGHDNELFVLLADLLELTEESDPLMKAVKVALTRHHRVLVICPWPPGIPPPTMREEAAGGRAQALDDATADSTSLPEDGDAALLRTLTQTTTERFHGAFHRLRRSFARLGVPVVCAAQGDPVQLILERLDLLRDLRSKA